VKGTDLRHLKVWLQKGDIEEEALNEGITPVQASNIMAGRSKNFSFMNRIIAKAAKNKALKELAESI